MEGIKKAAENLGEHLTGELIENSGYEVRGWQRPRLPGCLSRALVARLGTGLTLGAAGYPTPPPRCSWR